MATFTVDLSTNRFAIAEEVLSSAAKVLVTAGFESAEVASLLRQAAEQLDSGVAISNGPDAFGGQVDDEAAVPATPDIYELFERYDQIPERRSLARLSKRASAIGYANTEEDLSKAFEILQQSLPLAEGALNWLVQKCSATGIQVEPHKDEWLERASDEELDHENQIVFLDDWKVNGDFQLDQIGVLARSYAHSGNLESFSELVGLIKTHKVIYERENLEEIERTADALKALVDFREFLNQRRGSGEVMQSTLLDEFTLQSGFSGGTYVLDGWLDSLSKQGILQRYKRSNRWRVVI
jgi:hypothetical protein